MPRFPSGNDSGVRVPAALRALLAGTLVLGTIGSCELPKPQIPSIGSVSPGPALVVGVQRPASTIPVSSVRAAPAARTAGNP